MQNSPSSLLIILSHYAHIVKRKMKYNSFLTAAVKIPKYSKTDPKARLSGLEKIGILFVSLDIEVINKACDFEHVHNVGADVANDHFALSFHSLHCAEQHSESCT